MNNEDHDVHEEEHETDFFLVYFVIFVVKNMTRLPWKWDKTGREVEMGAFERSDIQSTHHVIYQFPWSLPLFFTC